MSRLEHEIASWDGDGKSASQIKLVYVQHCDTDNFIGRLLDSFGLLQLESGATWLLKHHLEQIGALLDEGERVRFYASFRRLEQWDSRLHVLQCMPYVLIPAEQLPDLLEFLDHNASHKRPFVRAWVYNGYYEVARQYPEYQNRIGQMLHDVMLSAESASVKARVRNVIKKGF